MKIDSATVQLADKINLSRSCDLEMYNLEYCIVAPVRGGESNCSINVYGNSKEFETIEELRIWVFENDVKIENINEI